MTKLQWDQVGERFYETGLSHGVLYLADGSGVPWNGLVGVDENAEEESEPVYFDGVKVRDFQKITNWAGTIRAITYPDEFIIYDGHEWLGEGLYASDQRPRLFCLSYQTKIGNDLDSEYGVRYHLVYNLTAVPDTKGYVTVSDENAPTEFSWNVTSVPGDVLGKRPTAHIIVDPREVHPHQLIEFEEILYGSDTVDPYLPPFEELYDWIKNWSYLVITDVGDGTWTVSSSFDDFITWLDPLHTMADVEIIDTPVVVDANSYTITTGKKYD